MRQATAPGKHFRPGATPQHTLAPTLKALAIVICCYAVCFLFGSPSYLTNDDSGIQYALSGAYTGEPATVYTFANVIVSFAISNMYRLIPQVQWWFVYSHLLLFVGCTITNTVLCRRIDESAPRPVLAYLLLVSFDCTLLMHSIAAISFTAVPATLVMAIVSVLAGTSKPLGKRGVVVLVVLLALAFCHRGNAVLATLPYVGLALLRYLHIHHKPSMQTAKCLCAALIPTIALLAAINALNSTVLNRVNGQEFVEYNAARARYMDYPHDTYDENPELYQSVDWDYTLSALVRRWCFMDPRVNAKTFATLTNNSHKTARTLDPHELVERLQKLMTLQETAYIIVGFACTSILTLVLCMGRKRHAALYVAANSLGTFLLFAYQLYLGRILYRTVLVELLPATALNLALLHNAVGAEESESRDRRLVAPVMLTAFALVFAAITASFVFGSERLDDLRSRSGIGNEAAEYAAQHRENLYIKGIDVHLTLDPFPTHVGKQPYNLISWTIPRTPAAVFAQQLSKNGLHSLGGETFKQSNAYLMTTSTPEDIEKTVSSNGYLLYVYLQENYGATGYELVDSIGEDIYIYHFTFE